MSNKVSVLVYSRKVGSPVRKAVLVYFAERASDGGEGIWASKGTIADAIEYGRSTVIRTINEFVVEGILIPVGTRGHKNGETVEYDMNLAAIEGLPKAKDEVIQPRSQASAGLVPQRDPSHRGTPPIPEQDPYQSRSGTQTTLITTNEPPKGAGAQEEGFSAGFWKELLLCLGVSLDSPGKWWHGDKARSHVQGWLDLGLTETQIVATAIASRKHHPESPDGPKALDGFMRDAAAIPAAAPRATANEMCAFWAERINGTDFVAPSSISPRFADDLLRRGLVDPDALRQRGIAFTSVPNSNMAFLRRVAAP